MVIEQWMVIKGLVCVSVIFKYLELFKINPAWAGKNLYIRAVAFRLFKPGLDRAILDVSQLLQQSRKNANY